MIDKGEIEAFSNLEEINLGKDTTKEPLNAFRVRENHFITASYSPERPWLITHGLSACKGIVFLDKSRKSALMAHLGSVKDLDVAISRMAESINTPLADAEIYIIMGSYQSKRGPNFGSKVIWPTISELINEIQKYSPKKIFVDPNPSGWGKARGIALNLNEGKLYEIGHAKDTSRTFSSKQDISRNMIIG